MDSHFINFDGRSVHDMIELLLAASGDSEALRRLQESINDVDRRAQSSIAVVNAAIEQLDEDTGWKLLSDSPDNHISNGIYYRKRRGIVFVDIGGPVDVATTKNNFTVVGRIPYEVRPSERSMETVIVYDNALASLVVDPQGKIRIKPYINTVANSIARGSISYPV